ncbi:penicillin-binding protein activator, partial [Gilliamella apicola]
MNLKNFFYIISMSILLTFLTGCPGNQSQLIDYDGNKSSSYYLSQADESSGNVKTNWQLLAIQALIKENKVSQAKVLLSQISSDLNDEQQNEKLLLQGEIAVKLKKPFNIKQLTTDGLTNSQLYRYYSIKLSLDEKSKDINGQAHDYIELEKYTPGKQKNQILN